MMVVLVRKYWRVCAALSALACGFSCSAEGGPQSTVTTTTGGQGGSGGTGTADANILVTGGAPSTPPRSCPAPRQCPAKVFDGDFRESTSQKLSMLEGVTEITGSLDIRTLADAEALSCLTRVNQIRVDAFGSSGQTLDGLRSVAFVGGSIDISGSSSSPSFNLDCAFQSLESLGSTFATGGAIDLTGGGEGTLDLSRVKQITHIRIADSDIWRLVLPSDATLRMGQLRLEGNMKLNELDGFERVNLEPVGVSSNTYTVRIVLNPLLSTCRARKVADIFLAAGVNPSAVTISNNAQDCS